MTHINYRYICIICGCSNLNVWQLGLSGCPHSSPPPEQIFLRRSSLKAASLICGQVLEAVALAHFDCTSTSSCTRAFLARLLPAGTAFYDVSRICVASVCVIHQFHRKQGTTGPSKLRSGRTPDRTGSSGRTYCRTVTGPITEPRPDPETRPTSDDVLEWFP